MPLAEIMHLPLRSRSRRRKRLRTWLRGVGREISLAFECGRVPEQLAKRAAEKSTAVPRQATVEQRDSAVLPFPLRGEVLLAQLASVLRGHFAGQGGDDDPLLLTISHGPPPRLTIDRLAHVEFHEYGRAFHLAVEAGPDTTLLLETADIEIVFGFVVRYIDEKLSERASFEAAR